MMIIIIVIIIDIIFVIIIIIIIIIIMLIMTTRLLRAAGVRPVPKHRLGSTTNIINCNMLYYNTMLCCAITYCNIIHIAQFHMEYGQYRSIAWGVGGCWLRTNGVNTNGAVAKIQKGTPWHFW